ncbi:hypothetical protein ACFOLJ_26430 [Rugamonas sp. CCM 8940]|uniref:hypothetical protein n=1 Tax=Rugamonas sp. CCM 8940 TaxID=2765359 RepID=UPI0018F3EC78|nr:hypothetical protein [Rugamonas sp. CCM 8940]MBJ7310541.1 hypothetical protein [Rugamonas sp. CCM 8940]
MLERVTYSEIRAWLLECYYGYCQMKLFHGHKWDEGEHELGYAYEQYCDAFLMPIENLMLEVLSLVLASKRLPKFEQCRREKIAMLMPGIELDEFMLSLPADEAGEFLCDLKILKLV